MGTVNIGNFIRPWVNILPYISYLKRKARKKKDIFLCHHIIFRTGWCLLSSAEGFLRAWKMQCYCSCEKRPLSKNLSKQEKVHCWFLYAASAAAWVTQQNFPRETLLGELFPFPLPPWKGSSLTLLSKCSKQGIFSRYLLLKCRNRDGISRDREVMTGLFWIKC